MFQSGFINVSVAKHWKDQDANKIDIGFSEGMKCFI